MLTFESRVGHFLNIFRAALSFCAHLKALVVLIILSTRTPLCTPGKVLLQTLENRENREIWAKFGSILLYSGIQNLCSFFSCHFPGKFRVPK